MSEPFIGEIRMFGGNYAPQGWMLCEGQKLSISENEALFSLIGTTYGGDGQSTFALPDLRERVPLHQGVGTGGLSQRVLGSTGGVEKVAITAKQLPAHSHPFLATENAGDSANPSGNAPAKSTTVNMYSNEAPTVALHPDSISPTGGGQSHNNMAPYLCVNFIISLDGIYPTQS
jgi:microcystin-dependent protein